MSRIIKFRAWDKGTAKLSERAVMCQVSALDVSRGGRVDGVRVFTTKPDHAYMLPIEDVELMQFTGLLDRNGKEIFEGDIPRDNKGRIFEVKWNDLYAAFGLKDHSLGKESAPLRGLHPSFQLEVIGNIYENPELLEAKS